MASMMAPAALPLAQAEPLSGFDAPAVLGQVFGGLGMSLAEVCALLELRERQAAGALAMARLNAVLAGTADGSEMRYREAASAAREHAACAALLAAARQAAGTALTAHVTAETGEPRGRGEPAAARTPQEGGI